jgi:uncharacterized membrane protein YgcG
MQVIAPLTIEDFNKGAITVIAKVEIDTDGEGNFQELPDIKTYNISTNEENRVAKFCSHSFNITCLNTDDRYGPLNSDSDYYGWLKQGRKIKLWAGIAERDPFQLILGRIDDFKLNKKGGRNICTITGRCLMRMILDFKLYSPNTYWGTSHLYSTEANKIRYNMEDDCKGIYKVELDYTNKDGTALEEIFENTDWSYDWHNNQLIFTPQRIPDFAGTNNNLKVYYMTTQTVENVVGHILYLAGVFATTGARDDWINNAVGNYVTPTGKEIDRVWFNAGTSALKAITLLSEVVQYRFYFDYEGNPIFKPKPSAGAPVNTISDYETKVEDVGENVDETYTHIIVIGEERDRILGEDEIAPDVPVDLTLSTGMGEITQASLAWLKAEWTANTESDFGHYELRIRKIGDSDYTEVSTTAITFIWYSLEPGVEYVVIIRAVDIYNNRSEWSSVKIQLTAADTTVPAPITGAIATPLLAGIKVEWTKSMGTNIAGYAVERQESENGVTWTGGWSERVRTDATTWLDLHLPYTVYYRYQIKAFTQTGVEGPFSSPTQNSIKPNKAGTDDIVARSITGDHIAVNTIMANNYQELRNTYVQQGQDSLDAGYPFELDFEIVSEMTSINNIKLSFRIRKFRAYAKGAASGGGATSASGGGQSSGAGGGPTSGSGGATTPTSSASPTYDITHQIFKWIPHNGGYLISQLLEHHSSGRYHTHMVSIGSHTHSVPSHTHYVYAHTHYVYAHTHNLTFGIYEETQYPTINVYIDNGAGYGSSIGAYTTDKLDINITGYISGTGFKRVKFTSNKRTRISAWVLCKIDLSA